MDVLTMVQARLEHMRNQTLPREAIQAQQTKKFRRLIVYAQKRSPYYARVIAENRIDIRRCRPEDFPILTKREVMESLDEIVTDPRITKDRLSDFVMISHDPAELFEDTFHVIHTSGSSGEKGFFVYSQRDWARGLAHSLRVHDIAFRKRRLAFVGSVRGHFAGVSFVSSARQVPSRWFFTVEVFDIHQPLQTLVAQLNRFQPDILAGYSTALRMLAEKQLQGVLRIHPSVVESSGEPVLSNDRSVIETAFQVTVSNLYMCTEHMYMGIQKPGYPGMYLLEDDLVFEIKDDHTCVTNLFNYTLPLIRYRMDDILIPDHGPDGILPFTKIKEVIGRNEHTPIFTNNHGVDDFINWHVISGFVTKRLRRIQLQLIDHKSFVLKACLEKGLTNSQTLEALREIKKKMTELLAAKEMDNVSFDIKVVEEIPIDPSTGKFKLILPAHPSKSSSLLAKAA